jgi:hypothetical protein
MGCFLKNVDDLRDIQLGKNITPSAAGGTPLFLNQVKSSQPILLNVKLNLLVET